MRSSTSPSRAQTERRYPGARGPSRSSPKWPLEDRQLIDNCFAENLHIVSSCGTKFYASCQLQYEMKVSEKFGMFCQKLSKKGAAGRPLSSLVPLQDLLDVALHEIDHLVNLFPIRPCKKRCNDELNMIQKLERELRGRRSNREGRPPWLAPAPSSWRPPSVASALVTDARRRGIPCPGFGRLYLLECWAFFFYEELR